MSWKHTWLTTSGMTGLTLPGIIELPGCVGGRLISLRPARGPDDNSRRSLQIFEITTAARLSAPENSTNAPESWVADVAEPGAPREQIDIDTIGRRVIRNWNPGEKNQCSNQQDGACRVDESIIDGDRAADRFERQERDRAD